jgi:hypothetical protein
MDQDRQMLAKEVMSVFVKHNIPPLVCMDVCTYMVAVFIAGINNDSLREATLVNLEQTVRESVDVVMGTRKVLSQPN